jgi:hypothetical protein
VNVEKCNWGWVPLLIVPDRTANTLARTSRWGGGASTTRRLGHILIRGYVRQGGGLRTNLLFSQLSQRKSCKKRTNFRIKNWEAELCMVRDFTAIVEAQETCSCILEFRIHAQVLSGLSRPAEH